MLLHLVASAYSAMIPADDSILIVIDAGHHPHPCPRSSALSGQLAHRLDSQVVAEPACSCTTGSRVRRRTTSSGRPTTRLSRPGRASVPSRPLRPLPRSKDFSILLWSTCPRDLARLRACTLRPPLECGSSLMPIGQLALPIELHWLRAVFERPTVHPEPTAGACMLMVAHGCAGSRGSTPSA